MKKSVVPEARQALESFKEEMAKELSAENKTRAGSTGGLRVKKLTEDDEKSLTSLGRS